MPNTYWQRFLTTEERFWRLASRSEDTSQCWLWQGALDKNGYGKFSLVRDGRQHQCRAHRVSYELANGPIPDGMVIDHLCRTPACVNPYHMETVTVRDNTLRGDTIQAANSRKTHCKRGHLLEGDNLRLVARTDRPGMAERHCRACRRLYMLDWNSKHPDSARERQAAYRARKRVKQV